tara:strand:- start:22 stop:318 length:297 start_codon:yes stop_codon:yes gene_type:complete
MSEEVKRIFNKENATKFANELLDQIAYEEFWKEGVGLVEIDEEDFGNDPDNPEDNYFSFTGKWGVWREGEVHYFYDSWSWFKEDFYDAYDKFYGENND